MKKVMMLLLISIVIGTSCQTQSQTKKKNKQITEFVGDLSTANTKLRGKLKMIGEYKGDLSSLTFKRYIELLGENETYSNKGINKILESSDKHLFIAKKNSFLIAIYSKKLNIVLYDNANTPGPNVDSLIVLSKYKKVPVLTEFISRTGF